MWKIVDVCYYVRRIYCAGALSHLHVPRRAWKRAKNRWIKLNFLLKSKSAIKKREGKNSTRIFNSNSSNDNGIGFVLYSKILFRCFWAFIWKWINSIRILLNTAQYHLCVRVVLCFQVSSKGNSLHTKTYMYANKTHEGYCDCVRYNQNSQIIYYFATKHICT